MATPTGQRQREFEFTDEHFHCIIELVRQHAGIKLSEAKRDMAYSRLVRRLRELQLDSFDVYCRMLREDPGDELIQFTNAITTNLTAFFRENHHFDHLAQTLLPALLREKAGRRQIRIWSAGCSTGEEPYSIAMVAREVVPQRAGWEVKISATDLDSNVLATAGSGVYPMERVETLPQARLRRWFLRGKGGNHGRVKVRPELRELIEFGQLNLLREWPFREPFDIIFCRNVVIYFDKPTQRRLFDRYADILAPGGHLFIGHSESLFKVSERFELLGNTIYRKIR